jgi:hypothetical protein
VAAAIAIDGVAVVAYLAHLDIDKAVAADLRALAIVAAAIAVEVVAIIAYLAPFDVDKAVAASFRALAIVAAAIAVEVVAVVAHFAWVYVCVTADLQFLFVDLERASPLELEKYGQDINTAQAPRCSHVQVQSTSRQPGNTKFLFPGREIGDQTSMWARIGAGLCLLAAVPARAGVIVQPGVPFTVAQLEVAIAARGGPEETGLDIEVSSPSPERLVLVTLRGRWEIEIGAASGEAAARIVALHVIELAGEAAAIPAAASAAPAGRHVAIPAAAVQRPISPPMQDHYRLAALGVGSRGTRAGDFTSLGGAVELTRTGRWIVGGGIAWQHGLAIEHTPGVPIAADLVRARAVVGMALGPVELVAVGFAGRNVVDGGTGTISRWDSGLAAEVRAALPVSAAWAIMIAAGAELFRERIEVQFDPTVAQFSPATLVGATPRVALSGGIGLAWIGASSR